MKGNNGSGNVPERDTWQTPQALWDNLNKQYFFSLDCCASPHNTKCYYYEEDFLNHSEQWFSKMGWMNPPFSKACDMFEHFFKTIIAGVCIYRCDNMETKIWQDIIFKNATWVLIPKGRICYEGMIGKGSRFPSALIGFNVKPPKYVKGVLLELPKR